MMNILRSISRFPSQFSLFASSLHTSNRKITLKEAIKSIHNADDAQSLFHYMLHLKPRPHMSQYHMLLTLVVRMKEYQLAVALFERMVLLGCRVNEYFMNSVLHCNSEIKRMDLSFKVVGSFIKRGFCPDVVTYSELIRGLFLQGSVEEAVSLFKKLVLAEEVEVDEVVISIVLDGLCKSGEADAACQLLHLAETKNWRLNVVAYTSLIRGLFLQGSVEKAFVLFEKLAKSRLEIDEVAISIVLDGLCKSGEIVAACKLLDLAERENWKLNVVAYNSMVDGFCKFRMLGDALKIVSGMVDRDIRPDIVTYNTLLHGLCNHNNLDLACCLFNDLPSKGVDPDLVTYTVMIQGMCIAGQFQVAKDILDNMEKLGFVADSFTCNIILDACIRHGNDSHSINLLKQIVGRDFQLAASTFFVLLGRISSILQMPGVYDNDSVMQLILKLVSSDNWHKVYDPEIINSLIRKVS